MVAFDQLSFSDRDKVIRFLGFLFHALYVIVDHREELYKSALDIIYMAGTFLGGEVFGIVGWRVLGSEIQWSKLCQDS